MIALLKKHWPIIAVIIAAAGLLARMQFLEVQRDRAIIDRNNAEAARDSVTLKYATDSTVVIGILAWQQDTIAALRKIAKLYGKTKAATRVVIRPDSQVAAHHDSTPRPEVSDPIVLRDSLAGPPADVWASVLVDAKRAEWAWTVRPHTIPITVDVGCRERLKPDVLVETPSWVRVDSVHTRVDPKVCGFDSHSKRGLKTLLGAGLVVGGFLLGAAIQ